MTPLRIIFMGTPEFAVPTLAALAESGHSVVAVYTQPPRPAGRGQKDKPSPVHQYAVSKNLPVYTPASLKDAHAQHEFEALKADVAIVAAYGLLLPKPILGGTKMGCINVHPSLLPRWRGAAPIQRSVMAGDKETGIVIMQMDAGLDTGDMLMVKRHPITDGTTAGELHDRLAKLAAPMVLETLSGLKAGTISRTRQPEDGIIYAHKITREECNIDWNEPAAAVRNKILGLSPHPGAYCVYKGENIKILRADTAPSLIHAAAGTVIDEDFTVACADGALIPRLVQRPGKKPMATEEMLKGFPFAPSTKLE